MTNKVRVETVQDQAIVNSSVSNWLGPLPVRQEASSCWLNTENRLSDTVGELGWWSMPVKRKMSTVLHECQQKLSKNPQSVWHRVVNRPLRIGVGSVGFDVKLLLD